MRNFSCFLFSLSILFVTTYLFGQELGNDNGIKEKIFFPDLVYNPSFKEDALNHYCSHKVARHSLNGVMYKSVANSPYPIDISFTNSFVKYPFFLTFSLLRMNPPYEVNMNNWDGDNCFNILQCTIDHAECGYIIRLGGGNFYEGNLNTNTGPDGGIAISPGNSPGCDTINGDLTLNINDEIVVDIEGNTVCLEYDRLTITGDVNLANADLVVNLSFAPSNMDEFQILEYSGVLSGTFEQGNFITVTYDGIDYLLEINYGSGNNDLIKLIFNCSNFSPPIAVEPDLISGVYQIDSFPNLLWMSQNSQTWNADFVQTSDIDAVITRNACFNNGAGWDPMGSFFSGFFTGNYDGNNNNITNLFIYRPGTSGVGFFGRTADALISNLSVHGSVTGGLDWVGLLVGDATEGTVIENCHSSGSVFGSDRHVGGLAGRIGTSPSNTVMNSSSSATVNGERLVGGLIGFVCNGSTVAQSFATGPVSGRFEVGGLIGTLCFGTTAEDVYATGSVTQKTGFRNGTGGLVGRMFRSKLFRGYSSGELLLADPDDPNGFDDMGGLVGSIDDNSPFEEADNFWDIETSGLLFSEIGSGKSSAEMMIPSLFTNWDFTDVWTSRSLVLDDSVSYPYLQNLIAGDIPGLTLGTVTNQNKGHNYLTIQTAIDDSGDGNLITFGGGNLYIENVNTASGPSAGVALSPGIISGCDTIDGNFLLTPNDDFVVDIEGSNFCTEYDRLNITGDVNLNDANLVINLDYMPQGNLTFIILEYEGTLSGQFNQGTSISADFNSVTYEFTINYGAGSDSWIYLEFSSCEDGTIELSSAPETDEQIICFGESIENISYNVGGSANGVSAVGLPNGLNALFDAGVFTISGTPSESGTFNYIGKYYRVSSL